MTIAFGSIRRRLLAAAVVLLALGGMPVAAGAEAGQVSALLDEMRQASRGRLVARVSPATGVYGFIRATADEPIFDDGGRGTAEARALGFLERYGAVVGVDDPHAQLRVARVVRDRIGGMQHVRLDQVHRGLRVFGAQLVVHLGPHGVTAVNGAFVPDVDVSVTPRRDARTAGEDAVEGAVRRLEPPFAVASTETNVYRVGLIEGVRGPTRLAHAVEVSGADGRLQVWVDDATGVVLNRIALDHDARFRVVHTPEFTPLVPDLFAVRTESDLVASPVGPVENLYRFAGQVYDLMYDAFGFDAYNGAGAKMRSVYLINDACPNAYWDGYTTNYCPGFDLDDVVGHEWLHGYTDYTHNLIYQCQPGALNESYSDIFGEVIDLLNGEDGLGGANNAQPFPFGQRWLIGEDLGQRAHELLLRDMWDPERLGDPARVRSGAYFCGDSDNEGVHTNSGVPNHAFAMLADGKTYRGTTVTAIGLTKTAHVYWRAMEAYQTPTSQFRDHDQALRASCADLIGANLPDLVTGAPSGQVITSADCTEVGDAMFAVQMSFTPQCGYQPVLAPNPPAACAGSTTIFSEDFSDGLDGWTTSSAAALGNLTWPDYQWAADSTLPRARAGTAAYAVNADAGNCRRGPSIAGRFALDSPAFAVPEGSGPVQVRFTHYVATRPADGGNLAVSVNGGDFTVLPQTAYTFNAPNEQLPIVGLGGGNTNPKAGEFAWTGMDGGQVAGSWGTSVADLAGIAGPGDSVRLRFDFGVNCQGGIDGWYVDDVTVLACPPAEPA